MDPNGPDTDPLVFFSIIGVTTKRTQVDPNGPGTDPLSSEFPNNCPSKTDPTPV